MNQRAACFFVALCGILRSTDLYFRKDIIDVIPVMVLIAWEHLINLFIVSPVFWARRREFLRLERKDLLLFVLVGFGASAMGVLCFSEAFHYTNPALIVLLQKLQPIITILLGTFVLQEKLSRHFFFWALVAILSSYFVSFGLKNPFTGEGIKMATGAFYAVLAAIFWGSGTVWGKILLAKYDQSFVLACRFLLGAVFTVTLAFVFKGGLMYDKVFAESKPLYYSITYMAVVAGILATSFFYAGLRWVNASLASVLELFFPVSSVLIMWFSFNQPITAVQIVAALVLFLAVYLVNLPDKTNPGN
jgi:drug/metabolite transporter (DMT)-like permease